MSGHNDEEMSVESDSVFSDCVILYLDFLGVSEAASSWSDARARELINALNEIAGSRASFTIDGEPLEDGSYKVSVTPETSTFSDHIVASYPIPQSATLPVNLLMDIYLKRCQDMVARVAKLALDVGLLIRGGITRGKLYHAEGVVFGEAMIDAYNLESRVAIFPRVVVSSRIYKGLLDNNQGRLLRDVDGIWHLNYFVRLFEPAVMEELDGCSDKWAETIERNISSLEIDKKWNEFAKWCWFKGQITAHTLRPMNLTSNASPAKTAPYMRWWAIIRTMLQKFGHFSTYLVIFVSFLSPSAFSDDNNVLNISLDCSGRISFFRDSGVEFLDDQRISVRISHGRISFAGNGHLIGEDIKICTPVNIELRFDSDSCDSRTHELNKIRQYGSINAVTRELHLTNEANIGDISLIEGKFVCREVVPLFN